MRGRESLPVVSAPAAPRRLDLAVLRERLAGQTGPRFWRSLEELAETPEFEEMLHREFPRQASVWAGDGVSRRRFLQLMSASLALGGLAGCTRQPDEKIVPYVDMPEGIVPGKPLFFATTHTLNGYGRGVVVESHMGRPTKVEGNPHHPASLGATDVFAQASVLDLYDPGRLQAISHRGRTTSWARLTEEIGRLAEEQGARARAREALGTADGQGAAAVPAPAAVPAETPAAGAGTAGAGAAGATTPPGETGAVGAPTAGPGAAEERRGVRLRVLTGAVSSPTLLGQLDALLARYPEAKWHVWEPAAAHGARAGVRQAGGGDREPVYDLSQAQVVLTLDSDFLVTGAGAQAYARQFTAGRRRWHGAEKMRAGPAALGEMGKALAAGSGSEPAPTDPEPAGAATTGPAAAGPSVTDGRAGGEGAEAGHRETGHAAEPLRLYAVESTPTPTGSMADHRLPLPPSQILAFARRLAGELGAAGGARNGGRVDERIAAFARAAAEDLRAHSGAALVVPGDYAPAEVHALAHAMNRALGAVGRTVHSVAPVTHGPADQAASLRELVADLEAERVDALVILGGNPVFTAPADFELARAMQQAPLAIYLTAEDDETAALCHWLVPEAHYLESWGDARAFDGTVSLVQPLIAPLYEGSKTAAELVAAFLDRPDATAHELVREHWQGRLGGGDFERAWRRALHDGVIAAPAAAAAPVEPAAGEDVELPSGAVAGTAGTVAAVEALRTEAVVDDEVGGGIVEEDILDEVRREDRAREAAAAAEASGLPTIELVFRPDPTIWDGRWANNGWLQEIPKPLTKLAWDNALLVSPRTADELGVTRADLVTLRRAGRTLTVPVWVMPGHADGCGTLHFGYGRRRVGPVGRETGFDAYSLRTSDALWTAPAVEVERAGGVYPLACTQDHFSMEGRHLVRHGTFREFAEHPTFVHEMGHVPEDDMSMYPGYEYEGYAWGMAVDLNACTGCNACVAACVVENNSPVVGKEQVIAGREMHWLRIDRYYEGPLDDPRIHHQPVMCQHCELAPCEVVCPVAATVHSDEGTNDMIYNRCVGTRYCSNNCPYKVRRFNFLQYVDTETELLKMVRNPDVTVRGRGVMEKCTYCIQRINAARIESKREGRAVRDGEIVTACQQACPSDAIVLGDVNDPGSRVSRWKDQHLDYGLLAELNTRPRTSYLAKLTHPNPALAERTDVEGR